MLFNITDYDIENIIRSYIIIISNDSAQYKLKSFMILGICYKTEVNKRKIK